MNEESARAQLLARIAAERAQWRALVAEVGPARTEEPGPMGAWTFKDLAAHLTGWRERTIARIAAGPDAAPPPPWPAALHEDDEINAWIYEQNRERPVHDVLADADASYARLAAAIAALPAEDVAAPGRFAWMEGRALTSCELFGHLHEEHEPDVRAWLGRRGERA